MKEPIASLQNPRVKLLVKLREKSSERQKQGLFIIEGLQEIALALEAGIPFREIFYCPALTGADPLSGVAGELLSGFAPEQPSGVAGELLSGVAPKPSSSAAPEQRDRQARGQRSRQAPGLPSSVSPELLQEVSLPVFEKIAYRDHSGGLIALAEHRPLRLSELKLSANPFLIILEAVEKPGNLGAVLRTADAAKADAVIICDPKTDLCNPNVIRSSLGCVFTNQVVAASSEETLDFLKEKNIKSYAAALTATNYYHETDLTRPSAVVMGTESTGLTEKWLRQASAQIKIPMRGKIDSLNVSTSCAIIAFEAMRQRRFP